VCIDLPVPVLIFLIWLFWMFLDLQILPDGLLNDANFDVICHVPLGWEQKSIADCSFPIGREFSQVGRYMFTNVMKVCIPVTVHV